MIKPARMTAAGGYYRTGNAPGDYRGSARPKCVCGKPNPSVEHFAQCIKDLETMDAVPSRKKRMMARTEANRRIDG